MSVKREEINRRSVDFSEVRSGRRLADRTLRLRIEQEVKPRAA